MECVADSTRQELYPAALTMEALTCAELRKSSETWLGRAHDDESQRAVRRKFDISAADGETGVAVTCSTKIDDAGERGDA